MLDIKAKIAELEAIDAVVGIIEREILSYDYCSDVALQASDEAGLSQHARDAHLREARLNQIKADTCKGILALISMEYRL